MEWQLIKTAPKDGTRVLLCGFRPEYQRHIGYEPEFMDGYYSETWGWVTCYTVAYPSGEGYDDFAPMDSKPTHWMPLPSPPASELGE